MGGSKGSWDGGYIVWVGRWVAMWKSTIDVEQACRTFCEAQRGLHRSNMKFNTQNEELYNYMHFFTWVFFNILCAIKIC